MTTSPDSRRETERLAGFDVASSFKNPKFLAFLDKLDEGEVESLNPNESDYAEKIQRHFEIFSGAEELKNSIKKTLKEKMKADTGMSLSDADFNDVEEEINREAVTNPESLLEKLKVVKSYNELPGEISRIEGEITRLGGREALDRKKEELTERQKNLRLASGVGFLDRFKSRKVDEELLEFGLETKRLEDEGITEDSSHQREFNNLWSRRIEERISEEDIFTAEGFFKKIKEGAYRRGINVGNMPMDKISQIEAQLSILGEVPHEAASVEGISDDISDIISESFEESEKRHLRENLKELSKELFGKIIKEEKEKLEKDIESAVENSKRKERVEAFDREKERVMAETKGMSFLDKVRVRMGLPESISGELRKITRDLAGIDNSMDVLGRLEEHRVRISEFHAQSREAIMGAYGGIQDLAENMKRRIAEKFNETMEGVKKDGISPAERNKKLAEARKLVGEITDDAYLGDLDSRRAEIQGATEEILDAEVYALFTRVSLDEKGGAYNKILRDMTLFLNRREVGEKTGDDAKNVIVEVMKSKAESLRGVRKVLIRQALAQLRI